MSTEFITALAVALVAVAVVLNGINDRGQRQDIDALAARLSKLEAAK
jgi:hypothetical protein